ncbi:MAG: hypothetical protein HKL85_04325 [Acidimicrobiaceae bacterium]|nr:hypothetical protein [Acidimicrobiaceae bacterium]
MKFRRATLVANIVIIGATLPTVGLSFATASNGAAPLYQYDSTPAGAWSTQGLTSDLSGHSIIGNAHGVTGDGEFALSARLDNGHLGLFVRNANAATSFYDMTTLTNAPTAASDPNVFLDPFGNIDMVYVSTVGHLILITPHTAVLAPRNTSLRERVRSHATPANTTPSPGGLNGASALFSITDLTVASHIPMSPGLVSASVSGLSGAIFDLSTKGDAIVLPMQWHQMNIAPSLGPASDVTAMTSSPTLLNTPVSMPGITNAFAATSTAGHVEYFSQPVVGSGQWTMTDVTNISASPPSTGQLSISTNGSAIYVASLSSAGHVQLFINSSSSATAATPPTSTSTSTSTPTTSTSTTSTSTTSTSTSISTSISTSTTTTTVAVAAVAATHVQSLSKSAVSHIATFPVTWKYRDLTAVISGSPVWTGSIFLNATSTSINVAGRAANWGDIYDYTDTLPAITWTSNDVSLSSGATTATTAIGVTGVFNGTSLQLFAPGLGTVSARGVGVYAIPSNDWGRAISDGWPIISETGGMGTLNAPWVGFAPPTPLNRSPDYLMGQSIVASKKRETWLSFWTVSGPLTPADQTVASYYSHGFLAGQWVAQQIDKYHLSGLNLKPNWVILDPEGYPDNHSALDAPAGSSNAVIAKHATYWTAMLNGWATGMNDVDPNLHPGVYASMSEYRNYGLTNTAVPVFQAIAFGGGGPIRVAGSSGHNILGYIAFNAVCSPTATLRAQEKTLMNPPWSGQYNTLQFNAGVYCAP